MVNLRTSKLILTIEFSIRTIHWFSVSNHTNNYPHECSFEVWFSKNFVIFHKPSIQGSKVASKTAHMGNLRPAHGYPTDRKFLYKCSLVLEYFFREYIVNQHTPSINIHHQSTYISNQHTSSINTRRQSIPGLNPTLKSHAFRGDGLHTGTHAPHILRLECLRGS